MKKSGDNSRRSLLTNINNACQKFNYKGYAGSPNLLRVSAVRLPSVVQPRN